MSKYTTKDKVAEYSKKDYLDTAEITKRVVIQVRHDLLYRTHMAIHNISKTEDSKKITKAHKLVADELQARGFMHHQWDKLDTSYLY